MMSMPRVQLVVGGAGFIGTSLVRSLEQKQLHVLCVDNNLSNNLDRFRKNYLTHPLVEIVYGDINDNRVCDLLAAKLKDTNIDVWHLAANSDIRLGSTNASLDAVNTFQSTVSVCNLLEKLKVSSVNFASTAAVYGELSNSELFSETSNCRPISYYGVAKLAAEWYLSLTCDRLQIPLLIFRFANIVGVPATHGVMFDLLTKLSSNPEVLNVLGDGSQLKSYLYVNDLVQMMTNLLDAQMKGIYNLGPGDNGMTVNGIVDLILKHLITRPKVQYGETPRGWLGDSMNSLMSTNKYQAEFGENSYSSKEAIHKALHEIAIEVGLSVVCRDESIKFE